MMLTDEQTDRQTDGQSGPSTRSAFAKATQVKINNMCHNFMAVLADCACTVTNMLNTFIMFKHNI